MNDWQAQTCLIASWLDSSSSTSNVTKSFVNCQNEFFNHNLNENNASNSFNFDDLLLDEIDLTCDIELDSANVNKQSDDQQLNLNTFDLSDTKLFDFINEIELFSESNLLEDSSCLLDSPSVSSNEISDSGFDSFSSSSSPSSESDCSSLSSASIISLDQSNKIKMIKTKNGVGHINKKESNKAAASRYRSKKSKEKDQLFVECEYYEKKNSEMKQKISDIESEIQSIRSLLVQALLVKNDSLNKLSSCGLLV